MAKPTALGVYIFAGGFTLGVETHFRVLAHFEDDGYGVSTFRKARPRVPVFVGPDRWPWDEFAGVDFIYGNPPCAAWSPLGPRIQRGKTAWKHDARIDCVKAQFNLLELMRPKIWAWESVPQAFKRGRALVDYFTWRAHAMGYDVSYVLHNARYFGALHNRKRFFFVAHRVPIRWKPLWLECPNAPEAIASCPPSEFNQEVYKRPTWDEAILDRVPAGKHVRGVVEEIIDERLAEAKKKGIPKEDVKLPWRASYGLRRCPADKPCGAIIGDPIIHPIENRFLSIAEMLHMCGFPLNYPLTAKNSDDRPRLIGRGVVPPVGRWLAGNVARTLRTGLTVSPRSSARRIFKIDFSKPPGEVEELTGARGYDG